MKLVTKELENLWKKYPFHSQDGKGYDSVVIGYWFLPNSQWTWFATEAEKYGDDWEFYGYVKGIEDEWGYFTLSELQEVRSPPIRAMIRGKMYQLGEGLPVEREMYTAYGKVKLKDLINR